MDQHLPQEGTSRWQVAPALTPAAAAAIPAHITTRSRSSRISSRLLMRNKLQRSAGMGTMSAARHSCICSNRQAAQIRLAWRTLSGKLRRP